MCVHVSNRVCACVCAIVSGMTIAMVLPCISLMVANAP